MKIQPEWIEWKGGECPVDGDTLVAYELRDGRRNCNKAGWLGWFHYGSDIDIIAYCPLDIEPYKPKWTVTRWESDDQLRYKGTLKACFVSPETAQRIADALNAAGVEL